MVQKRSDYTITYSGAKIVLEGANEAIHLEAEKIIKRFAYSPNPYQIESNAEYCVVLVAKQ